MRVAGCGLRVAGCGLRVAGCGLRLETSDGVQRRAVWKVIAALGATGLPGAEPVYRIVVTLDRQTIRTYGNEHALRAGMVFEADILQDRRRLIEWWLEPLFGVTGG